MGGVRVGGGVHHAVHDYKLSLREMNHCVQNGHAHFVDTDNV